MNLLLTSVLLAVMAPGEAPPRFRVDTEKALLVGGAMVMPAEIDFAPVPDRHLPPEVLGMKDYLIARSYYQAQVAVKYTDGDHKKYTAELDAMTARDIKNRYHHSVEISRQAAQGHALSQRATMMRMQQVREQQAQNRLPYKKAATHQPFRPSVIRNNGYPYYQPGMHYYGGHYGGMHYYRNWYIR
jgi:hypothetical protein